MTEGIRPSFTEYGDWRKSVSRSSFLTNRNNVIRTGTESVVYIREAEKVVIKEFTRERTLHGYELAAQYLPGLVAPFVFIKDFPISVDFKPHIVRNGVAQAKVEPLDIAFMQAADKRDPVRLTDIVRKHIIVDRAILERGILLPDQAYTNFGKDEAGNVVLTDAGGIKTALNGIVEYMVYVNGRGEIHYSQYLVLKTFGEKFKMSIDGKPLEDAYCNETGLHFDPSLSSFQQYHELMLREKHRFNPIFWEVGQQEMELYAPAQARYTREDQARLFEAAIIASQ